MLLIAYGVHNPALVRAVRRFRESIYAEDHVTVSTEPDETSYHVVVFEAGSLAGCLRYTQTGNATARLGAWCVAAEYRASRVAVDLVLACFRLAGPLGDTRGVANATVRHGSAQILQKLGGRVVATYWDSHYQCEMQRLEFSLRRAPALRTRRTDENLRRAA